MPVPQQRDPQLTRRRLTTWLADRLPDAADLRLTELTIPPSRGFANETLIVRARTATRDHHLVVRVEPAAHRVYPRGSLDAEYRLMRGLAATGTVPVPAVHFHEPDASVLGAPFLVMSFVPGDVPGDLPSYHSAGWLAELEPRRRAEPWRAALAALAAVHRLRPGDLGLGFLDRPAFGPTGTAQELGYYAAHLDFFGCADEPVPLAALEWLKANRPAGEAAPGLLWGDARLGNIVFRDLRPVALLDWEMAALGPAEIDLGWFLWMDRFLSEGIGVPRLAGLPGRAETVAEFGRLLGRPVRDPHYYEVLAGFRFALITARVQRLLDTSGTLPPGVTVPLHANAVRLLAAVTGTGEPAATRVKSGSTSP
ncbi:aminoglycoside phosphotransferase (APT) family kinase protein [Streptosporangium becharense]|uniref:Aminoglycoside phosphotransferase (APT) family kinase protein n=1 Tax=Streptosporangium becharense TaxID=1816182 RepID=A0A7W9MJK9_9ACTN|nr:phosphotransferase family protein [Streptosporangium becharense]MBB2910437.1 aminoglycoside phosphotransferase (APT) family kinase protein [Streptosporangium becharense]MBB5823180.1 aminoglycoside phosphotransferase (APT) family kinase protein [Streptosporangium becharense]